MVAMRVDRLPVSTLPIFNGSGPPAAGEALEHVQIFKNGGVGALGQIGTQDAAVRAERWAWLTVTRKEGELRTYVNGRLCAEIKLEIAKLDKKSKVHAHPCASPERAHAPCDHVATHAPSSCLKLLLDWCARVCSL